MATIKEDYCSYEVAKLLKEKGFDEICYRVYNTKEKELWGTDGIKFQNHETDEETITAPTLQMAMKWLREVHNKYCDISYDVDLEWYFQIVDLKETVEYDYPEVKYYHSENETNFKTYEQACEAAIKYCLENLI